MKFSALLISSAFLATSVNAADLSAVPSGAYAVDTTHAYINFQYNHLGLSNPRISFDEFDMQMNLDTDDPTKTTVAVDITADSVDTGSDIFNEHITGGKWFDTANNPKMTFASTGVTANSDGTFNLEGDLTIKETTKPVVLLVTVNAATIHPMKKAPVLGISAVGGLKRSEWGLGANAPFVSDEVKLEIQAEMFQAE